MSHHLLNRKDAPFADNVWALIDSTVIAAAKSQLSARRIIDVEGPYGLGAKSIAAADVETSEKTSVGDAVASVSAPGFIPLAEIVAAFCVSARDVAYFETTAIPFDTAVLANAAIACARQEDALLLNGSAALGVQGLLNARGSVSHKLHSWKELGAAADDAIAAVTRLDDAGCHGPYALALAPALYNLLYRRYQQGPMTELEHVKSIVTDGIVKASAIADGGVLIASGREYASIALGQDMSVGFVGPVPGAYEFTVSESVALRLKVPQAVCVLKGA